MKKPKMYVVLSNEKNYLQGAFPYTEEGKKLAIKYQKKIKKIKKINTHLVER